MLLLGGGSLPFFLHIRGLALEELKMKKIGSKIFSWMVVEEIAAVAVCLIFDIRVGFDLVGTLCFGDIDGGQERVALVVDDDIDAVWVIDDLVLLLLLHVLN
jgi:hypothetical protein